MTPISRPARPNLRRPAQAAGAALLLAVAGWVATAQLAPGERGVPPVDSSSNFEVTGVHVDIAGRTAEEARTAGWRAAQRQGWKVLWARTHGASSDAAPALPDGTLDSIVAGIEVEQEQIGTHRYIATLALLFDRARVGPYLGGADGRAARSSPMLVLPLQIEAGSAQSFETRTDWQKAWARFRSGGSAIDYVRPVGTGVDPLVLQFGQSRRPGRIWWRTLLDQYGASDIVIPEVHLRRLFPGGPVRARFVARHGPDAEILGGFELVARDPEALAATLDEGVRGLDRLYTEALRGGRLSPDPSLTIEEPEAPAEPDLLAGEGEDPLASAVDQAEASATPVTLQVDSADAAQLDQALAALRSVPGVSSPTVVSLAIGGQSLVSTSFGGDIAALRQALAVRGWRLEGDGATLRLRRAAAAPAPPPPAPAP